MTRDEFRDLVEDAIDTIPRRFARQVRNLAIVIEDEPDPELLDEMNIGPEDTLLGLYQGTPLSERGWGFGNQLPDRITLFQYSIEDDAEHDEEEIIIAIGETLIHELGHYFGLSEEEIMEIEERYWRGEPDPEDAAADAEQDATEVPAEDVAEAETQDAAAVEIQDTAAVEIQDTVAVETQEAAKLEVGDEVEVATEEAPGDSKAGESVEAPPEPEPVRRRKPRKRFAQHFLEPAWVTKVVAAVDAQPGEALLEIGPGRAAITRPLAKTAGRLLAIEVDRDLAAELERDKPANVTVVTGDFLEVDLGAVIAEWLGGPIGPGNQVRVVGNLPYNISTPILFRLIDLAAATGGLRDATLMLQKEVADRLVARVGTRDYGVLAILTGYYADVTRQLSLPPGAFRPAPKVRSAVVRLSFRPPQVEVADPAAFVRMVRSMFTQRRKTLLNALKEYAAAGPVTPTAALAGAGIDKKRRPETLTMEELAALARAFAVPGS